VLENYKEKRPDVCEKCCEKMNAEHTSLLFCCHWRWLSQGNILTCLQTELYQYLTAEGQSSATFMDCDFNMQLAYLHYIFFNLNTPNTSLQGGGDDNIIQVS
jgi:hypothetical protein